MPNISPELSKIKQSLPSFDSSQDNSDILYKWVDENGKTQYSQQAPSEGITTTTVSVNSTLSVIEAVKPHENKRITKTKKTEQPENTVQLIEQAKNVQKIVDDRDSRQRRIIDAR